MEGAQRERLGDGARSEAAESRLLHAIFDRLPALIAYWDSDLHNVIANDAYVEWFGFTPEQMRGIHIREVLGEEVYAKNLPFIRGALAGEEQLFDRTLVDTFGRTRHTQASYVPDIVDGEVRGFFVLVTDVTPRVVAQRAMDEAQSIAGVGSWEWSPDVGDVVWSNHLYRIFGVDPERFVPTIETLMAMVHPEDVARVTAARDAAVERGVEYANDYRIRRPDGTVREVHSRGRPIVDVSGAVVRVTGTLQDVTEANQAARELARVNSELVQVNQLNADVLGMLGHDVRAPLSVILGYLEELDERWEATEAAERHGHVATVRRAAVRLRALVDDILSLATVDAGTIVPRTEVLDIGAEARHAVSELPEAADVDVTGDPDVLASCDAFHLRQILVNLVSNALRYGEPPVRVEVGSQPGKVVVTVADEGPGVPEDFLPRLFERFSRADDLTRKAGSTGFGLYIARRLAQTNGGTLRYEAGPSGSGARFVLTLPAP